MVALVPSVRDGCALWRPFWVRRRTFLDLRAVVAGGLLLPGAVNSCLEGRSACKTPSNLLFSTPNGLNVSPGRVESLFENIQSLGGFSWLALPSSCILFTHLLSSVSPCQLPTTNADVNQVNHCILEIPCQDGCFNIDFAEIFDQTS